MVSGREYWTIYATVQDILKEHFELNGTDAFISECVLSIEELNDPEWTKDDVIRVIKKKLTDLIQKNG